MPPKKRRMRAIQRLCTKRDPARPAHRPRPLVSLLISAVTTACANAIATVPRLASLPGKYKDGCGTVVMAGGLASKEMPEERSVVGLPVHRMEFI
ncbi:hypothetical protein GCM10010987_78230 [Bradyrhizobium guangdongense]|uniref:Uncharacterized protein n=1 Tax=Bradyrhizobium guangdongense TaxID=1325090 RepID=A0AA87WEL0_9BRAD|nr:hypothetical protein GCM10010987_78230 [Bradyrhizobium guangdongense]